VITKHNKTPKVRVQNCIDLSRRVINFILCLKIYFSQSMKYQIIKIEIIFSKVIWYFLDLIEIGISWMNRKYSNK